jgi:hypothetical protein
MDPQQKADIDTQVSSPDAMIRKRRPSRYPLGSGDESSVNRSRLSAVNER